MMGPLTLFCASALSPLSILIAIPGFALCSRLRMRGFAYALILLGVTAFIMHGFFTSRHLWQFGLELSLAFSFLVTALTQEENIRETETLSSQLEAQSSTLRNLEEELQKTRETLVTEKTTFDAKMASLQTNLEETDKDGASLQILNEVLRKTAATHIEKASELEKNSIDLERKIALMRQELSLYQQPRPDRDELMRELNAARVEREQTHLINETLAKLHAQKCQELEELQLPKGPSQTELLYNQLRKQFEEKNHILHQTRQELFRKETELEALKIAEEQQTPDFPQLHEELERLSEENKHLETLVSSLSQPPPPSRKKKAKSLLLKAGTLSLF